MYYLPWAERDLTFSTFVPRHIRDRRGHARQIGASAKSAITRRYKDTQKAIVPRTSTSGDCISDITLKGSPNDRKRTSTADDRIILSNPHPLLTTRNLAGNISLPSVQSQSLRDPVISPSGTTAMLSQSDL
ncbi:hypothetical protein PILCRDRAFT_201682 [Piloderma croceum F 1598]|uniref:Uncharacterized protein n=1 Tax=Piloderma croceum (strain F 1598) TaxID=765440 RepID=A0A0C3GH42_PILCF|nr:hypothetical protein PILCRDRAFT_201682 [Piloderma croceum F 1598]